MKKDLDSVIHDLRTPLAKAKTITKLLIEETENEYLPILLKSLEEIDEEISKLKNNLK